MFTANSYQIITILASILLFSTVNITQLCQSYDDCPSSGTLEIPILDYLSLYQDNLMVETVDNPPPIKWAEGGKETLKKGFLTVDNPSITAYDKTVTIKWSDDSNSTFNVNLSIACDFQAKGCDINVENGTVAGGQYESDRYAFDLNAGKLYVDMYTDLFADLVQVNTTGSVQFFKQNNHVTESNVCDLTLDYGSSKTLCAVLFHCAPVQLVFSGCRRVISIVEQ